MRALLPALSLNIALNSVAKSPYESSTVCRCEPGAKTFRIATVQHDTGRPRNGLGLRGRRGVGNGVHFERALTLSTEGRKDELLLLLLLLSKTLSLPGEEMQQKYKCRVETAVGATEKGRVS